MPIYRDDYAMLAWGKLMPLDAAEEEELKMDDLRMITCIKDKDDEAMVYSKNWAVGSRTGSFFKKIGQVDGKLPLDYQWYFVVWGPNVGPNRYGDDREDRDVAVLSVSKAFLNREDANLYRQTIPFSRMELVRDHNLSVSKYFVYSPNESVVIRSTDGPTIVDPRKFVGTELLFFTETKQDPMLNIWSVEHHRLFPLEMRRQIKAFFLSMSKSTLPRDVTLLITTLAFTVDERRNNNKRFKL